MDLFDTVKPPAADEVRDAVDRSRRFCGWPAALIKAVEDYGFGYALMLRGGSIVEFKGASESESGADWVVLDVEVTGHQFWHRPVSGRRFPFGRGIEIRVSDIVWVADAPWETP